uniref:Reverse transcriptase RNase H-like domain-containing protein n=1 Tax=Trichogramma kaykai TaxID=54128 RepID=A0ABD2WHY2_9HYME
MISQPGSDLQEGRREDKLKVSLKPATLKLCTSTPEVKNKLVSRVDKFLKTIPEQVEAIKRENQVDEDVINKSVTDAIFEEEETVKNSNIVDKLFNPFKDYFFGHEAYLKGIAPDLIMTLGEISAWINGITLVKIQVVHDNFPIFQDGLLGTKLLQECRSNIDYLSNTIRLDTQILPFETSCQLSTDPKLPYLVTCDASGYAIGGFLAQSKNRVELPIGYVSRMLTDTERRYDTYSREALVIVFTIEKFKPYLLGNKFTVYTDHKPLLYFRNSKDPNSRISRYQFLLNSMDFDIQYKPGTANVVADCLSRNPVVESTFKYSF